MEKVSLPLPAIRCLSKQEAASYLGIGVTLLSELDIPFVKLGRRCLYDRVDLDIWMRNISSASTGGLEGGNVAPKPRRCLPETKIPASGGLQQSSPNGKEYAKVLGLENRQDAKHC